MYKKMSGVILLLFVIVIGSSYLIQRNTNTETGRMYNIGILVRGFDFNAAVGGYKERMTELGYVEGENVTYHEFFESDRNKLLGKANELVRRNVDLIHTYTTPATKAAYEATKDMENPIPVVFGSMGNPIASGTVKDTQRSGTNVTGVASLSTELTAKRVEILSELVPGGRFALPRTNPETADIAAALSYDIAMDTAERLGVNLVPLAIDTIDDNAVVANQITAEEYDGIVLPADSLVWGGMTTYIARAREIKLPLAVFSVDQVISGALVGYGPDYSTSGVQSADMSDKILTGVLPTDLPIQAPLRVILVLNKTTADIIGIEITNDFLSKVDLHVE